MSLGSKGLPHKRMIVNNVICVDGRRTEEPGSWQET